MAYSDEISRMKTAREEGLEEGRKEGRKEGKQLFLQCIRLKKQGFSKEKIEEIVVKIITENQNNDRETGLGEVGSRLVKVYPDFDVRRYGYSLLSKFLETLPNLKLILEGTKVSVTLYEDKSKKDMLEEYIIRQIQMTGDQGISLGTLGNRIRIQFGDFKVRDYGYSQFKQYIQSFPKVELIEDGERTRAVYVED